jgi:hypothetical protein
MPSRKRDDRLAMNLGQGYRQKFLNLSGASSV